MLSLGVRALYPTCFIHLPGRVEESCSQPLKKSFFLQMSMVDEYLTQSMAVHSMNIVTFVL